MEILQTIVLAIVQGVTEFLPISSSAHLILVPELLGWAESGLAFDVAVHVGTLIAVIYFLREEIKQILPAWLLGWRTMSWSNDGMIGWLIVVATLPLGFVGLVFAGYIELQLRTSIVIAFATLIFGLLLGWADAKSSGNVREIPSLTFRDAIIIGLCQVCALVPGTSRSGVTMTALLALGYTRVAAAKFSFLLAVPAIALPGVLKSYELSVQSLPVEWSSLLLGAIVSAVVAFLTMHWFISFITRVGLRPFVIYRVLLAIMIVVVMV